MVDPLTLRRLLYRFTLSVLALLIVFFHLLPLRLGSGHLPGPDVFVAVSFAWVLRRPDYVPVLLAGGIMMILDMLFMRPPGLWAALFVIGLQVLRNRQGMARELPFALELARVGGVLLAMTLANQLVLALLMVDRLPFGMSLLQMLATLAAYPVVVLGSVALLRVRKITPGEIDQMGHRI
jgi:rod shape-determining protein MreD